MRDSSRGVGELVIRALARISLVLALTVLAAVFMSTAAQGKEQHFALALSSVADTVGGPVALAAESSPPRAPRTVGLVLALTVLGLGLAVLAIGALSPRREVKAPEDPALDLDLDLNLDVEDPWVSPRDLIDDSDAIGAA